MKPTWHDRSLRVIRQVVAENPGLDPHELRRKVSEAYPFGPRCNFPYKAWQRAVKAVLGPSPKQKEHQRKAPEDPMGVFSVKH